MTWRDPLWRRAAAFFPILFFSVPLHSGEHAVGELWQQVEANPPNAAAVEHWIRPSVFRAFQLNHATLRGLLARAPREFTSNDRQVPVEVVLPMPDGKCARFRVVESPIMAPELAAKFPEIKTYFGQGLDDPAATVRFDLTPAGLHAQVLSPSGAVYIEPQWRGDSRRHVSYFKRDYRRAAGEFRCLTRADPEPLLQSAVGAGAALSGGTLRTFRLAVAATGEYTQFHGGTVAAGLAAIVTVVNRVDGIYESELAIRLVLVANNDQIVFTKAATDPYSNNDLNAMLTQNQSTIDRVIGDANYDLGHVFCTSAGGVSTLAVVCLSGVKAHSVSGLAAPVGDPFYVDYVAHEIGHEFGAHHCFNGVGGYCAGTRTAAVAYEPGSGSTVLCYAGICGADDLQPHSDPYFHSASYDEIMFYVNVGFGDCAIATSTGNNPPAVSVGAVTNFNIPYGTPFTLTASGTDLDGDPLTYCWEERDLGPALAVSAADNGSSPLFRSFLPTSSPSRTFPKLADILNHTASVGETLPTKARTMKFRVTARDNRAGGGGVSTANMQVTVSDSAGPFAVTTPNTAVTWSGARTVTWNMAGTAGPPIGATTVDILLSTDGGLSFPMMLATNTPNDGSETVTLPNIPTTTARIKVQAHDNIFFDISDSNFTIAPPVLPFVSLVATDANASETGPHAGVLTVSRTGATTNSLPVSYSVGGTATSDADFTPLLGIVTIPSGSATATITVTPVDDALAEPSETVMVTLVTNAAYAIDVTNYSATVTIADNDVATLSISDATVVEGNSGTTNALFNVTLSLPSSQLITVNYATSNGTALAGSDYVAASGTLLFAPGQTTQTLSVMVNGDVLLETNENFFVDLSSPTNATLGRSQGVGTIVDDELRLISVARSGNNVQLEFNTLAGRSYRVESTDTLAATNVWTTVTGAASVPGTGGLVPVTDTNALVQPQRFYRVRLLP